MKLYLILVIAFLVLLIVIGILAKLLKKSSAENKALKNELQEEKNRYEQMQEIYKKTNTGDSRRDFDATINIVRNLKK